MSRLLVLLVLLVLGCNKTPEGTIKVVGPDQIQERAEYSKQQIQQYGDKVKVVRTDNSYSIVLEFEKTQERKRIYIENKLAVVGDRWTVTVSKQGYITLNERIYD